MLFQRSEEIPKDTSHITDRERVGQDNELVNGQKIRQQNINENSYAAFINHID